MRGTVALAVVLGLALRVAAALFGPETSVTRPEFDHYGTIAAQMAAGNGFAFSPGNPTAAKPPGYPAFLAGLRLIGGEGRAAVVAAQLALALASLLLILPLARMAGPETVPWAAFLWALHPFLLYLPSTYLSENLFLPVACLVFLVGAWWLSAPSLPRAALVGALIGATIYIRPVLAPMAILLPLLGGKPVADRRIATAGVMLAAALAVTAPWIVRNAVVMDRFPVFTTHGGLTLWGGNNEAVADGRWLTPEKYPWEKEGKAPRWWEALPETSRDRAFRDLSTGWVWDHPGEWLARMPKKILRLWGPTKGSGDPTWGAWYDRAGWLQWGATVPPFLLALLVGGIVPRPLSRVTWAAVITVTLMAAIFYGDVRFRLPVEPLVIVGAAALFRRVIVRRAG